MSNKQVIYRPGRIQAQNAEQEILFKQFWAYLLRYFGYYLEIDNQDLRYKQSFIASSG